MVVRPAALGMLLLLVPACGATSSAPVPDEAVLACAHRNGLSEEVLAPDDTEAAPGTWLTSFRRYAEASDRADLANLVARWERAVQDPYGAGVDAQAATDQVCQGISDDAGLAAACVPVLADGRATVRLPDFPRRVGQWVADGRQAGGCTGD